MAACISVAALQLPQTRRFGSNASSRPHLLRLQRHSQLTATPAPQQQRQWVQHSVQAGASEGAGPDEELTAAEYNRQLELASTKVESSIAAVASGSGATPEAPSSKGDEALPGSKGDPAAVPPKTPLQKVLAFLRKHWLRILLLTPIVLLLAAYYGLWVYVWLIALLR